MRLTQFTTALAIACVCLPTSLLAQPLSHLMAQCSALYYASSAWSTDPKDVADLEEISEQWFAAALDRAALDDLSTPYETLTNIANKAEGAWLSRGQTARFSGDYKDWMEYCRALADAKALDIAHQ